MTVAVMQKTSLAVKCQRPVCHRYFCLPLRACTVRRHCCDIILSDPVGVPHLSTTLMPIRTKQGQYYSIEGPVIGIIRLSRQCG